MLRRGENSFFENSGDGGGDEGLPPLISGAAAKQTFRPRFRVRTDGIRGMRFVIIVVVVVVVRQTRTAQSIERNRGKFVLSNSSLVLPSSESPAADQPSVLRPPYIAPFWGSGIDSVLAAAQHKGPPARPILQFFKHSHPSCRHLRCWPATIPPQFIPTTFYDCSISIPLDRWGR